MTTKKEGTQLTQGACILDTCFKVTEPDKNWGSQTGYVKILEIHDAPQGYPRFVAMYYNISVGYQFCHAETLDAAKAAQSNFLQNYDANSSAKIPGIIKCIMPPSIYCEPWFYAESRELVCGDYALPATIIRTDDCYPAGNQWLVLGKDNPTIETCQGVRHGEKQSYVYFDQGSVATFKPSKMAPKTVALSDPLWSDKGAESLGKFWNDFLAKGLSPEDEDTLEILACEQTVATFKIYKDEEYFNFHFGIKEMGKTRSLVAYSRYNVLPKQLSGTLIHGEITFAHVLCKLFEEQPNPPA